MTSRASCDRARGQARKESNPPNPRPQCGEGETPPSFYRSATRKIAVVTSPPPSPSASHTNAERSIAIAAYELPPRVETRPQARPIAREPMRASAGAPRRPVSRGCLGPGSPLLYRPCARAAIPAMPVSLPRSTGTGPGAPRTVRTTSVAAIAGLCVRCCHDLETLAERSR